MEIILGKTAGFCYGVKRAVDGSLGEIKNNKDEKIYCLGELVHNKQVVEDLKEQGIEFIDTLDEVNQEKVKIIIRAHGVEQKIYEMAKMKNIELIDYTCPNVIKIHKIAEEYQTKGYYIFLIGAKKHPEVIGIMSCCGENFSVIEDENDVEYAIINLEKSNIKNLLIIEQTTYNTKKFDIILDMIKEKINSNINLVIKNTICLATEVRQKEVNEISSKVEAMIIIGGKNSSNTKKLYEIALKNCKNTICIETEQEIEDNFIKCIEKIGIMAGASTPQSSIEKVVNKIKAVQ